MSYLLNTVYLVALIVFSPLLAYSAIFRGKYREGYAAKLLGLVPRRSGGRPCIWFHAVSVGEVNLLRPLLDRVRRGLPHVDCVISTTTKTGFEVATRNYPNLSVFYCPLDFSWSTAAAMRRIRPDLLVLAELELWPNLVQAARSRDCRVAIVNGRLSERSAQGYRRIRWLVRRILAQCDWIAAQNPDYARRFESLGGEKSRIHVTGSLKFDGAETDRGNVRTRRFAKLAGIEPGATVFLAGSTQHPEEALALEVFARLQVDHPDLRLILAPRHPERCDEIAALLDRSGFAWRRRSELDQPVRQAATPILLIDVIGELAAWWGTAAIALVGGSFGSRGGQNMIEPAAYGAAVCFGPNTRNFRDVVKLMLDCGAAEVVEDREELLQFVRRPLTDRCRAEEMGRRAQKLVREQLGAADRTVELIQETLDRHGGRRFRQSA